MADKNRHHLPHAHHGGGGDVDDDDDNNDIGRPLPRKRSSSASLNRGAWTPEEDATLAEFIQIHGPRRWKSVATKSGLNRCGKSCRLRWLNYLRPDIKRGNISEAEDDLILRLHRLLGNKWSLIARRLPGRTDNEIKNYWNAHLRKKAKLMEKLPATSTVALIKKWNEDNDDDDEDDDEDDDDDDDNEEREKVSSSMEDASGNETMMMIRRRMRSGGVGAGDGMGSSDVEGDELFDFSRQGTCGLEWVKTFLELEEDA